MVENRFLRFQTDSEISQTTRVNQDPIRSLLRHKNYFSSVPLSYLEKYLLVLGCVQRNQQETLRSMRLVTVMKLEVTWALGEEVMKDEKKQEILAWRVSSLEEKESWQTLVVGHCTFDGTHFEANC